MSILISTNLTKGWLTIKPQSRAARGILATLRMEDHRRRSANFSTKETDKLVHLIEKNYKTLSSKFSDNNTREKKNECWNEIRRRLNATSNCHRTLDQIKKKWEDLKLKTKRKAANALAITKMISRARFSKAVDTLVIILEIVG